MNIVYPLIDETCYIITPVDLREVNAHLFIEEKYLLLDIAYLALGKALADERL
jgi:hypothetical protein